MCLCVDVLTGIETLINAMHRRGADQLHSLTAVSNNAGAAGKGGLSTLTHAGQIDRLILSYLGNNKALEKKYLSGKIAIELCPQGTLAERLRAGGAGIPAFFTPTGVRKFIQCLSDERRGRERRKCGILIELDQTRLSKRERFPCGWMNLARYSSRVNPARHASSMARRISWKPL